MNTPYLTVVDQRPATPLDWQDDALCRQIDIGDIFFPAKGGSNIQAKRICTHCPVRQECLQDALITGDAHGIRGGLSAAERQRLMRRRRNTAA